MQLQLIAIAALIAASSPAHADTWATTPNNKGGTIELTDEGCNGVVANMPSNARLIFSRVPGGMTYVGCWIVTDRYVVARYQGYSTVMTYELTGFTMTAKGEAALRQ